MLDAEIIQVCLGKYEVQFQFDPPVCIAVERGWELFDDNGVRIDHATTDDPRPPYQFHRLLGRRVTETRLHPPTAFELVFDNGDRLRLTDTSDQYESLTIVCDSKYIVI